MTSKRDEAPFEAIDNAKAKDKRYDLTDGGGLVLEVMPSGSKTWRINYT